MKRARKILNMATSIKKLEQSEQSPEHYNVVENMTHLNSRDYSDSSSIPDSQPDLDLSILEDENSSYIRSQQAKYNCGSK